VSTPQHAVSNTPSSPDGRPPRIRQLMHSEQVSPILDAMSRSPEMLDIMRQLLERRARRHRSAARQAGFERHHRVDQPVRARQDGG